MSTSIAGCATRYQASELKYEGFVNETVTDYPGSFSLFFCIEKGKVLESCMKVVNGLWKDPGK